jgi:type IV secretory pathway TraG/TraD family ATPase VirD4
MGMWWGYKAAGKMIGGGARSGSRLGQGLGDATASRRAARVGARQAARGWLAPGDPTPAPTVGTDYLDYRGTATRAEVKMLEGQGFPIGAFVDFQHRRIDCQLAIPESVMNLHALVIGPAGSGKTAGIIVPWITAALMADWAVIAVDVKGDLSEDIIAFNQGYGDPSIGGLLRKWDYSDPANSHAWEWMAELTDEARLDAAVTAVLGRRNDNSSADPYFYQRDYRTLRGLLSFAHALSPHTRTAGQLIRLLQNDNRLQTVVLANPRAPGAGDLLDALKFPTHEYPKVVSGVVTALSAIDTQGAGAVTAARSGDSKLSLESVLDAGECLIIGAPLRGGQLSATLSSLMLNQVAQRLYERFGTSGRPVLLVIDEAAQVTDRVDIAQLMEVSRSAGAGVVVALQDIAKIKDENDRSSIVTNAATFVMLRGSSPISVKALSERLGQRPERTYSMQANAGWGAPVNQSFGTQLVPVMGDREMMQPPEGDRPSVVHVKAPQLGATPKPFIVDLHYGP